MIRFTDIRSAKGSLNFHNEFTRRFAVKGGNPKIAEDETRVFYLYQTREFPWSIYAPGKEPRETRSAGPG